MIIRKPSHQISVALAKDRIPAVSVSHSGKRKSFRMMRMLSTSLGSGLGMTLLLKVAPAAPEPRFVNWLNHPDFVTVRAELIEEGEL